MLTQATIQQIGDAISDHFQPEKIIFFGSYACGEAHPHSDLDLLIVVETLPPRGQRSAPILKMLAETYTEPIDIVVRSAQLRPSSSGSTYPAALPTKCSQKELCSMTAKSNLPDDWFAKADDCAYCS